MQTDMLTTVFELQHKLNARLGYDKDFFLELDDEGRRQFSDKFASACLSECVEIRDASAMNQTWWKDKTKPIPEVQEEWIDALHFVVCGLISVGLTPEGVRDAYIAKNEKNNTRKDWDINNESKRT